MVATKRDNRPHVLVLGLGISGRAAALLASRNGARVTVLDENDGPTQQERAKELEARGIHVHLGWNRAGWTGSPSLAVVSPGIPPASKLGRLLTKLACPVIGEMEYGYQYCPVPVLAITGTNGKTTTTELVAHCLKAAGRQVVACGNIGQPLSEVVLKHSGLDCVVAEVSSYQVETMVSFQPLAVAILNLTPDHLDRYPDADTYYRAKMAILKNVRHRHQVILRDGMMDMAVVRDAMPADDSAPRSFSSTTGSRADFCLDADDWLVGRWPDGQSHRILPRSELRIRGRHNVENALAAAALGSLAGISAADIGKGLRTFSPSAHRLELVTVSKGVRYINDSKATNPDSLCRALEAMAEETTGQVLLIAGGLDKGLTFETVTPVLKKCVREIFLIGKSSDQMMREWNSVVSCRKFGALSGAVTAAVDAARSGDTVLLSPGCASMDMFRDYAERGRIFCDLVRRSVGE